MSALKITIFSDPVCPWCLVGLHRLDTALATLDDDVDLDIVHHPFLLDASAPPEGEDVVEMLTRKYGQAPDEAWDRLEAVASDSGFALDMRKQKWRYPSQRAHVLIQAAAHKGTQHALAGAIGRACYVDALNISDAEVLTALAIQHGFEASEVLALLGDEALVLHVEEAAAQAAQMGVSGVPLFIFNDKFALSGAQPQDVFEGALQKAINEGEDAAQ